MCTTSAAPWCIARSRRAGCGTWCSTWQTRLSSSLSIGTCWASLSRTQWTSGTIRPTPIAAQTQATPRTTSRTTGASACLRPGAWRKFDAMVEGDGEVGVNQITLRAGTLAEAENAVDYFNEDHVGSSARARTCRTGTDTPMLWTRTVTPSRPVPDQSSRLAEGGRGHESCAMTHRLSGRWPWSRWRTPTLAQCSKARAIKGSRGRGSAGTDPHCP